MKAKKNIYALLVGINDYQKVRKLGGCLNDVNAIEKYLTTNTHLKPNIKKVLNAEATRDGIINGFRNHLSQAGKDDVVLFYYSGHGTQEAADTSIWKAETDKALECIVCYDRQPGVFADFLLTDKELRYLINELTQATKGAHIVTIFDCCNSGDNTRNGALMKASYTDVAERHITREGDFFPMRKWEEFLFADKIAKGTTIGEGTHVQMAACESNQSALEVAREGVFTKTLIKVLNDCGGNITYNALRSRIRQYMRASYEQTPRIYMPVNAEELLKTGFLEKEIESQKMVCEAIFNNTNGWQLNIGAIHGVEQSSKVTLVDSKSGKSVAANIAENGIFVDYTILDLAGQDENTVFKAEIAGLMSQSLVFELNNQDATPKEIAELTLILEKNSSGNISFGGEKSAKETEKDSGKADTADYAMNIKDGEVYFSEVNDPFRPIVKPSKYFDKADKIEIAETIRHLSRWHFIKNLENKNLDENFPKTPLKIELSQIFKNGTIKSLASTDLINYEKNGNKWDGSIQIKATNTTDQDLYFCAAYLDVEFQCFLKFLPQRVQKLEKGASIFLGLDGATKIGFGLGEVIKDYNWETYHEYIKFIISTEEFDAEALTLEPLPMPITSTVFKSRAKKKSLITAAEEPIEFTGWQTQTLHLNFKNPQFNQISEKTLKLLLENEETTYFATNLYLDISLDKFGQPTVWNLKKGIVFPEDEKGLLDNIVLLLANKFETAMRNKQYRNLSQDPSRLRIVAEGDSWFQYPIKLLDIIDQLYKRYAVKSFAEAGDTLKNYLDKKEYLDAIREENAKFFIVSGGGNDMVGDEFQFFLKNVPDPEDTSPKRYLNQKFYAELDKLEALYTEMFDELLAKYPSLQILVHCYDYVIPVDTTSPGNENKTSWSGKYMLEKGIIPQSERENLIRFILDSFAAKLTQLVAKPKFKNNITFIDTRGIVDRHSWFDEIHPTNEGYELVTNKFFEKIEEIRMRIGA